MIFCALLCMSQWAVAQDGFQELLFPAEFILINKESIHLNARQEERIKTIHHENQSLFSRKSTELKQANEQLKALLTAEKANESGINVQLEKVLSLENELKKMRFQAQLAMRNELNSRQVDQLKTLRQNDSAKEFTLPDNKVVSIRIAGTADAKTPSYFILHQGDYHRIKDINSIEPKDIESVSVLKDEAAVEKFGSQGRNGVIIITLKDVSVIDLDKLRIHMYRN
jgi:TonB-dependent SusC/RagA subfamily outer membrane receptor